MHQYDVSDPFNPVLAGKVELGGILREANHPNGKEFLYGPQMVEVSRDGKRVYWTNFSFDMGRPILPHHEGGQMVMANVGENGGLTLDPNFYINFPENTRASSPRRRRLLHR